MEVLQLSNHVRKTQQQQAGSIFSFSSAAWACADHDGHGGQEKAENEDDFREWGADTFAKHGVSAARRHGGHLSVLLRER
jgi:hypothetical protein